jgi:hypothetical protein
VLIKVAVAGAVDEGFDPGQLGYSNEVTANAAQELCHEGLTLEHEHAFVATTQTGPFAAR